MSRENFSGNGKRFASPSFLSCALPPTPLLYPMRSLLLLSALALVALATPAKAQLSFAPMVGYDLDAEALTVGLAFELGTQLSGLPLQPAIRPSVEYVFLDGDATYVRADGDLIGRFNAGTSFQPYAKAGVTVEYISIDTGFGDASNTEVGLNLGLGAEFNRLFVEGALGVGDISDLRVRAGYRF